MKLIFIIISLKILGHSSAQVEEVYCDHVYGDKHCLLNTLQLTEDNFRFKPVKQNEELQRTVMIARNSTVPILSSDICDTFPEVQNYEVADVNLHTIQPDAFANCQDFEQFPSNMMVNQVELTDALEVQKIDDDFFKNQKYLRNIVLFVGILRWFD